MNRSTVGYADNIEEETLDNDNFRKVLFTGNHLQLVLMTLQPGEEIGNEVHHGHDQFFRVEEGVATLYMEDEEISLEEEEAAIVPSGVAHNIVNNTEEVVRLYTIYGPPEHPEETVHESKP